MSKLYYRYGTMNSSKSLNLLANVHNYEENNKKVLMLKPSLDTRDVGVIRSRAGLEKECTAFDNDWDLYHYLKKYIDIVEKPDLIFIDEVQFCTQEQILQLVKFIDTFGIKVMCYGLKSDYTGHLFPATEQLMVYADDIQEIKTVCKYCDKKAIMNLRVVNGVATYSGDSIITGDVSDGDEEYYVPTCRNHYFNPLLDKYNH